MLNNINAMDRSTPLANSVALIQSSGTGKSRMVDEMAKLVFTIPFNVRLPDERSSRAYPPEDSAVWEYLCKSEVKKAEDGEVRAALFFQNLFSEVATEVEHVFSGRRIASPGELASEWWNHLTKLSGAFRDELYKRVVQDGPSQGSPRCSDDVRPTLDRLLAALYKFCDLRAVEDDVKVVLYFDEAHELYGGTRGPRLYDIMQSSLSWSGPGKSPVFTIFVSTQLPPSAKFLQASITETAFDCHPSFPLRIGKWRLNQLGELHFLARFGRPLFWTMLAWDEEGTSSEVLLRDMMGLARMKLIFDNDIYRREHSHTAMLVLLDVLIMIDYEPMGKLVRELEVEMVASHMKTAFSIPQHGRYVISGYPSEPFLAEAATCQVYHYLKKDSYFGMARFLMQYLDAGLIDHSRKTEMVVRLLLSEAYMGAVIAEQADEANSQNTDINFSKGCSLLGFLKALFDRDFHHMILNSTPDNVASGYTLESAFERAVVRFTHFTKAADYSAMTTRSMVAGFLRGLAVVRPQNLGAGIDIAIPILLDKGRKISEPSMSGLLIRVQLRDQPGGVDEMGFFPQVSAARQDMRPYMTLVAKVGVEAPRQSPDVNATKSSTRSSVPNVSGVEEDKQDEKDHPRYSIRAYGCTHATWNTNVYDSSYYTHILATDDLLANHPRQDATSLDLVHQMLPFWDSKHPARVLGVEQHQVCDDVRPRAAVEVGSYEASMVGLEAEKSSTSGQEVSMMVDESA
ncbi:hypothetical protein EV363DRAFT_1586969 [Boletus edulis]|nr:hypothetical protein EV363DRAFT_1586969 [Boletus edulis]